MDEDYDTLLFERDRMRRERDEYAYELEKTREAAKANLTEWRKLKRFVNFTDKFFPDVRRAYDVRQRMKKA